MCREENLKWIFWPSRDTGGLDQPSINCERSFFSAGEGGEKFGSVW